jgi:predicted nucleotidyltransferase
MNGYLENTNKEMNGIKKKIQYMKEEFNKDMEILRKTKPNEILEMKISKVNLKTQLRPSSVDLIRLRREY